MKKKDGKKASAPAAKVKNAPKTTVKPAAAPQKTPKVAAKPVAAPKKSPKKKKLAPPALSAASRQTKVKPPEGYSDMVDDVVEAWTKHSAVLRIEGRSPARLRSTLAKAKRAREREETLRKKLEEQIRPLSDARILVEEAMWTEVLDLYRVVKAMMPMRPELEKAFEMLTDHFSRPARPTVPSTPPLPQVGVLRDAELEDE